MSDRDRDRDSRMSIRRISDGEVESFRATIMEVFGYDAVDDPLGPERVRALIQLERTFCAFDGDQMVATAASFDLGLAVPGATVAMAGLTMVSVRPTHRRRGLLRRMMAAQLDDARARGEPLSGLWASEGTIYGRFGYGVAAEADELEVRSPGELAAGQPGDEVVRVDLAAAAREIPDVYARALAARPGMFTRNEAWWRLRRFVDRPDQAKGRSPRRHVVVRRAGLATGYLTYRQAPAWTDGVASGRLDIEELVALDARAEITLWRFATSIDLHPTVTWWNAPPDAVIPWIARDRRAVVRGRRADSLWLRVVDVAGALSARRYAGDGALTLAVDGAAWRLAVDGGVGRCEPTGAAPELAMSTATLGSIYLGGVAPSLLARAGAITGEPDAIARADRLFTWPIAPWCAEIF